jgi:hypothetical protein
VIEPSVAIDATTFSALVGAASTEPPLAGPTAGDLAPVVGVAAVTPIGVEVADFVARIEFVNPSDAADQPWDIGIAFREQENGDHYRLTVTSDGTWEFQIGLQAELAGGTVPSLSFEEGGLNVLEIAVAGDSAGFSVNGTFVSELNTSELDGASDVWAGAGFHQANAAEGNITHFEDFTVWPVAAAEIPTAPATPVAAGGESDEEIALRLDEQDDSGIDALAVLTGNDAQTTVTVVARGVAGGEVVVVHEGTCDDASTLPTFLLQDLDASSRSETTIEAPLSDLTGSEHVLAIHRSAEEYAEVVACGEIVSG